MNRILLKRIAVGVLGLLLALCATAQPSTPQGSWQQGSGVGAQELASLLESIEQSQGKVSEDTKKLLTSLGEQAQQLERILSASSAEDDRILEILEQQAERLNEIHSEVDKPLISELWYGFVSDRVNEGLNRVLGLDTKSSTTLWAVGLLSLGLLAIKLLAFFLQRAESEKWAARVGKAFTVFVTVYLVILTGSILMLAATSSDSPTEIYRGQLEQSEELMQELRATSDRVEDFSKSLAATRAQMDQLVRASESGRSENDGFSGVHVQCDHLPDALVARLALFEPEAINGIESETRVIAGEVAQVREQQPGLLWRLVVLVGALCGIGWTVAFFVHKLAED